MKALLAPTEKFIEREATSLTAAAVAGSTVSLDVVSNDGIAINDYVCVGIPGSENAELCQVVATGATTLSVGSLTLNHEEGEPVTKFRFNKRKFYGSTSATGTFTELTSDGSPADINVANPQGTYFEYTGSTYTYFKATYFNSTDSTETDIADSTAAQASETAHYTSIFAVRKRAGLAGNSLYSDSRIAQKRAQAENEVNSIVAARYQLPLAEVPQLISYVTETLAAGYIAYEEFPDDQDGVKWLGEARGILKAIQNGSQRLLGSDSTELLRNIDVGALDGFPNDIATYPPIFTMDDLY